MARMPASTEGTGILGTVGNTETYFVDMFLAGFLAIIPVLTESLCRIYLPSLGPLGLSVCFNSWAFRNSSAWRSRSRSA